MSWVRSSTASKDLGRRLRSRKRAQDNCKRLLGRGFCECEIDGSVVDISRITKHPAIDLDGRETRRDGRTRKICSGRLYLGFRAVKDDPSSVSMSTQLHAYSSFSAIQSESTSRTSASPEADSGHREQHHLPCQEGRPTILAGGDERWMADR